MVITLKEKKKQLVYPLLQCQFMLIWLQVQVRHELCVFRTSTIKKKLVTGIYFVCHTCRFVGKKSSAEAHYWITATILFLTDYFNSLYTTKDCLLELNQCCSTNIYLDLYAS